MTTNNRDKRNNNNINNSNGIDNISAADDLIGSGDASAATYSDESNGDGAMTEAMDPAPPVLSGANNSVDYLPGSSPVVVDSAIAVSDVESATLTGATVAITSGFFAGDTLNFTNQNGITGIYNAFTGVLTLSGTASLANYQAALASITFTSANGNPTDSGTDDYRTVSWSVTDSNGLSSNTITSAVAVGLLDGVEGAFLVYVIRNNAIISVQNLFQAGLAWTVAGFGDFSGNANETDMLLRNTATSGPNAGAWEVYDISKNTVYATLPLLVNFPGGPSTAAQWTVVGFGDFSSNVSNNIAEMRHDVAEQRHRRISALRHQQ